MQTAGRGTHSWDNLAVLCAVSAALSSVDQVADGCVAHHCAKPGGR
jgi:hypothetical protein